MPQQVQIVGDGLAACCAAHLLLCRDIEVSVFGPGSTKPAHLLISEQTQKLLCDIFAASDLFEGAHRVRRRIVRWGKRPAVELPHNGLVVSEQQLLRQLWQKSGVEVLKTPYVASDEAIWTVFASSRSTCLPKAQGFGRRQAAVVPVLLDSSVVSDGCWAESVEDGWLFLIPTGGRRATLISSGNDPKVLLEQSLLIRQQIAVAEYESPTAGRFSAFPRILPELYGVDWLACGSAAMAFDPICGEGAGHAAREAILAAAVIAAGMRRGAKREQLVAHYAARLRQGFLRHLQVCLSFYQSGGSNDFWRGEADELRRGVASMQNLLARQAPLTHRLIGYDLKPAVGAVIAG